MPHQSLLRSRRRLAAIPQRTYSRAMKDDPQFNIRFVKIVEKHPCLYNHKILEYSNREEQEKAWQEVATEINASVLDCKNKWKNLRGSLTRYLLRARGPQFGDKPIKPYYMYEALAFLLPFTKTRKPRSKYEPYGYWSEAVSSHPAEEDGSFQSVSECYEDEVVPWEGSPSTPEVDLEEETEDEGGAEIGAVEGGAPAPAQLVTTEHHSSPRRLTSPSTAASAAGSKRLRPTDLTSLEETLAGCISALREEREPNPDLDFFKSLLPDIGGFSPRQKRLLKQGVLRLIDDIEEEAEVEPVKGRKTARIAPPSSTSA